MGVLLWLLVVGIIVAAADQNVPVFIVGNSPFLLLVVGFSFFYFLVFYLYFFLFYSHFVFFYIFVLFYFHVIF